MALRTATIPNYVVLILGNAVGNPHHMQGHHTWDLGISLKKLVVLTLNIHQAFNFLSFFVPMFSPNIIMNIYIYTLLFFNYQPQSHMYVQSLEVLI